MPEHKPWIKPDDTTDFDLLNYDALRIVKPIKNKVYPKKLVDLLKIAYTEGRYSFGKCGYPDSGSFNHTWHYGQFYLTLEEHKQWLHTINEELKWG